MHETTTCCITPPPASPVAIHPFRLRLRAYRPLLATILVALLIAQVLEDAWHLPLPSSFMGVWLVLFAQVKLFDIHGFVARFAQYDVAAQRSKAYGYLFPFIELGLGLAYLGHYMPMATSVVLLFVASLSLVGVVLALRGGRKLQCACMGSSVDVPLSVVAVLENELMIGMAVMTLFTR